MLAINTNQSINQFANSPQKNTFLSKVILANGILYKQLYISFFYCYAKYSHVKYFDDLLLYFYILYSFKRNL